MRPRLSDRSKVLARWHPHVSRRPKRLPVGARWLAIPLSPRTMKTFIQLSDTGPPERAPARPIPRHKVVKKGPVRGKRARPRASVGGGNTAPRVAPARTATVATGPVVATAAVRATDAPAIEPPRPLFRRVARAAREDTVMAIRDAEGRARGAPEKAKVRAAGIGRPHKAAP